MIKIIIDKEDFSLINQLENPAEFLIDESHTSIDGKITLLIDEHHLSIVNTILDKIKHENSLLMFETKDGWIRLKPKHIWYVESFGEEILLHTEVDGAVQVKHPMYELEAMMKPYHFVRIGKSYIVNMAKIQYIRVKLNAKLDLELMNGTHLEVMRTYVKPFKDALGIRRKDE